ncbi:MAG: hypothetical protein RDA78_15605 [Roseibium sp.]|uniref:hypothetical protein n=1 Tax=Roseibium sp. TaxID=1936156 RepID=UPI003D9C177D
MSELSEWAGLLFGALVVVFYSFERFNRANYEERYNLDDLILLLAPDQLRTRTVVMRAYLGYTLMLLSVYFLVCGFSNVFALLGFGGLSGAQVGAGAGAVGSNADGTATQTTLGINPKVSLTVALVMVGLAPSVPILKRLEEQARNWAHRLAGIPTRVIGIRDSLLHRGISLTEGHNYEVDGLLIDKNDWKRIECCNRNLKKLGLDSPSVDRDLLIIFSTSNWILDKKLKLNSSSDRQRFLHLEDRLSVQRKKFTTDLDELNRFFLQAEQNTADPKAKAETDSQTDTESREINTERSKKWESFVDSANELARGCCLLIALYAERGIIQQSSKQLLAYENPKRSHWERQYVKAVHLLDEFIANPIKASQIQNANTQEIMRVYAWIATTTVLATIAWSLTLGKFSYELRTNQEIENWLNPVWFQFLEALFSFCMPLGIALMVYIYLRNRFRWKDTWSTKLTGLLPQYLLVMVFSWILTMLIVLGIFIWLTAANYSWELAVRDLPSVFEYEVVSKLRGVILAIFVIMLLDAFQVRESPKKKPDQLPETNQQYPNDTRTNFKPDEPLNSQEKQANQSCRMVLWLLISFVSMGFLGFSGQYLRSAVFAREQSRIAFDAIDGGLIFYSTLYSALIGLIVVYVFVRALHDWREGESDFRKMTLDERV